MKKGSNEEKIRASKKFTTEGKSRWKIDTGDVSSLNVNRGKSIAYTVLYTFATLIIGYYYFTKNIKESETNSLVVPINV